MKEYLDTVRHVLLHGVRKENRTGVDTLSAFNYNYQVDLRQGFPLLTTKTISWKNIVIENLWFLSGDTHVDLLRKHGCTFWDPWADEDGRVPSAYGNFWRHFPVPESSGASGNDQIAWVLEELRRNPMSRRLLVSAWAPGNAQISGLPPCHVVWVLTVQIDIDGQRYLNLHLTQRSCDVAIGVPYNIAGYAFLLALFSHFTGIPARFFAHTLIDAHIYTAKVNGDMSEYDHVPGLNTQLTRAPRPLPTLSIDASIDSLDRIRELLHAETDEIMRCFKLDNYDPYPFIPFKVAV